MLKRVTICGLIVTISSTLLATSALAQSVSHEQLGQCAKIKNALQRLVCFDELAARSNVASDEPVAVSQPPTPPAPPQPKAEAEEATSEFGKEHRQGGSSQSDRLSIAIKSKSKNARGYWVIETSDGQVWEQTEAGTFLFKDDANYYIERGILSSFYFSHEDTNRRLKVRRID
jgi:hypothetical protein